MRHGSECDKEEGPYDWARKGKVEDGQKMKR